MAKRNTKSPAGRALMAEVTDNVHQDLCSSEKQHGIDAIQNMVLRWILACLYYVSHKNDKAQAVWARYNFIIGGKPVSKAALVFWGLSKGVDLSVYEQLIEAILQRAQAYSRQDSPASVQFAFVMALLALSCCVTTGLNRAPSGTEILTRIRFFLKPYWATKIEWDWIVKHAHVTRHDFVDTLSVLLTHARFAPRRKITAVMPRRYVRKAA
jgi:hypothetical protein